MARNGPESRRAWALALAGGLAWVLALGCLAPRATDGFDFVRLVEPYGAFFRQSILRGELPWWNPYASLGRPFLADLQSLALYPATWLVIPFGAAGGWFVATALHGALAVAGFLRLGRLSGWTQGVAFAAAVCFLFSGPLFARMQAGQVNYVFGLCYLPLVLALAVEFAAAPTRRGWVALATIWALQLLCGHPQVFWMSALAAGLFVTGWLANAPWRPAWDRWWRAALGLATACGMSLAPLGFALLPFFQLVGQSNRAEPSLAFSSAFGMEPFHWLSLVATPGGAFTVNWEYDLHLGLVALVLGLVGLTRVRDPLARGALAIALGGAVIAAGASTPLFAGLYKILPGLANFRVPARAGVLLVLGLLIGASALVTWLLSGRARRVPGWLAGLIVVELVFAVQGWKSLPGFGTEFPAEPLVRRAIVEKGLDRAVAPVRVSAPADMLRENSGMAHGYATPVGFESLSLARVWNYLHAVAGADPSHPFNTAPDARFYDAAPGLDSLNLAISMPRDANLLTVRTPRDPRAYLVTQFHEVPDWRAAEAAMVRGHAIHREALIESAWKDRLPRSVAGDTAPGTARVAAFQINRVEVESNSPTPALLVLAEAWYPGWHAVIDGVEAPCLPANGWMRAAVVPAGKHLVSFQYREESFPAGCWLSLVAVAVLLGLRFLRVGRGLRPRLGGDGVTALPDEETSA